MTDDQVAVKVTRQGRQATIHDYKGLPGEPNPDEYPRDDDYRKDHTKWHEAKASGKAYRDPDMSKLQTHQKREARLDDSERKEMYEAGRQAGKEEAKPHMGPQFRPKKPMSARVFLNGMKRGVHHKTYKAPQHVISKAVRTKPRRSR